MRILKFLEFYWSSSSVEFDSGEVPKLQEAQKIRDRLRVDECDREQHEVDFDVVMLDLFRVGKCD